MSPILFSAVYGGVIGALLALLGPRAPGQANWYGALAVIVWLDVLYLRKVWRDLHISGTGS